MDQPRDWQVVTEGGRVKLRLPLIEGGQDVGYVYDMAPETARELVAELTRAADEAERP